MKLIDIPKDVLDSEEILPAKVLEQIDLKMVIWSACYAGRYFKNHQPMEKDIIKMMNAAMGERIKLIRKALADVS